jgi:hypothetical protein
MTCRIGPEPRRTRLDSELSDADWEVETDDDVEGTWHTSRTSDLDMYAIADAAGSFEKCQ